MKRQPLWLRVVAGTVIIANAPVSYADHPSIAFGHEASGPVNTISALSLPRGALAIGLRNEYIDRDALSDARLAGLAADGIEGVHSVDTINSASIALAYGLSETLSVSVRLPWVARESIREGELEDGAGEAHSHGDASGIGDLLALANWRAWNNERTHFALQLGLKAPSGETDESDRGQRLDTEFQPGSGAWDVLTGAALSRVYTHFSVHTNILYGWSGSGAKDTELGDVLSYNVALVYALPAADRHADAAGATPHRHLKFDALIELNGETRWNNAIAGVRDVNSGGTVLYVSPGMRATFGDFATFVSVGLPIVDNPHGIQSDVSFRLSGGLSMLF